MIFLNLITLSTVAFLCASSGKTKKATVQSAYFITSGLSWRTLFAGASSSNLTTTYAGEQATVSWAFGSARLYATKSTLHPLYVLP